jgi:rhodanese-related sulfurtransferase
MTSWLYFYIAASLVMIVFFVRKYKTLRPILHAIKKDELEAFLDDTTIFVDVRSDKEWERDPWQPAINIPHDQISSNSFNREEKILLVCNSGIRASHAASTLKKNGFTEVSFFDGYYKDVVKFLERKSS